MAVVNWTKVRGVGPGVALWKAVLTHGDTTDALEASAYPDKTVHIVSDSGTTMTDFDLKGSNVDATPKAATNDGNYLDLHMDFQEADASAPKIFNNLSANTLAKIKENPRYIKVTLYADGGSEQSTTVYILGYTAR